MSDLTTLVRDAQGGDPRAWPALVARFGPLLRARAARYRLQEADAGDAMQNTWLHLAEQLPRVRDPELLGGWLATTMSRECLLLVRSRSRLPVRPDPDPERTACDDPGPAELVVDSVDRADAVRAVRQALAGLPERRRRLIDALFADDRRPYAEIARACGVPVGSIGPSRARILRELRGALRPG